MDCSKCLFYNKPFFGKAKCKRIPNYNFQKRKMSFFDIPDAQKICKGYFFEHKDSDLYRTSDESLSNEPRPPHVRDD